MPYPGALARYISVYTSGLPRNESKKRRGTNPLSRCSCTIRQCVYIGVADTVRQYVCGRGGDAPSAKNESERIPPCCGENHSAVINVLKGKIPTIQKMDPNLRAKRADVQ